MKEQIFGNGIWTAVLITAGACLIVCALVWYFLQRRGTNKPQDESGGFVLPPLAQEQAEERARRLEEVVEAQKLQITEMEAQLVDAAKLRHDFRQELLVLQEFARSGNREELERYLPQVKLGEKKVTLPLCPNPLVNTMLQFYFGKARAAGITVDAAVQADEALWLTASDVGVLFGNLLENAVTAAAEAPEGARTLRLRTTQTEECFVIAMGNTYGAPRISEGEGVFSSTKTAHKGIGLGSIRAVALRYDGEAKYQLEEDMFMSYVILLRPKK